MEKNKKRDVGNQTMRAWKLKRDKNKDKNEAKGAYEAEKSIWRKIREAVLGSKKSASPSGMGDATMAGQKLLKDKGYSTLHASDMMKEIKGTAPDHITDSMIIKRVDRVEGEAVKANEVALLLKKRIPNYEHGMTIRYKGREFLQMRVRRLDSGYLYHLKLCR